MTNEEKELLLKDLSARLPYGIKVKNIEEENTMGEVFAINRNKKTNNIVVSYYLSDDCDTLSCTLIEFIKPYLRPLSSMTEEEKEECKKYNFHYENGDLHNEYENEYQLIWIGTGGDKYDVDKFMDYLISQHFDYRGLIKKGLALEAPEDMYKQ